MKTASRNGLVIVICAIILSGAGPNLLKADNYAGAEGFLRKVQDLLNQSSGQPNQTNETAKFRDDLKAFNATLTNLPPAEAAKQWLALADRAAKLRPSAHNNINTERISSRELFSILPPPPAWNALAKAVAARPAADTDDGFIREAGLKVLAAALTVDTNSQKQAIIDIQNRAKTADMTHSYLYRTILDSIHTTLLQQSTDPDAILQSLDYQVDTCTADNGQTIEVPDLVSQISAEKADAFLRKALVQPGVTLQFSEANQTSRLAQKLALELMDQLKKPQWGLVNSLDAVDLYEALEKKFPDKKVSVPGLPDNVDLGNGMSDFEKMPAKVYYMLGLISHDRAKDAVEVAKKIGTASDFYMVDEAFNQMQQAGYVSALDNFFYELLSQDPSLQFWDEYVDTAAKAGQTDRMVALASATAARTDLSDKKKLAVRKILFRALLAADKVDEGVEVMRQLIAQNPDDTGQLGVMLAQIGVLLNKPAWITEGIDAALKGLAKPAHDNSSDWETPVVVSSVARLLEDQGRGPEAETVLAQALAKNVQAQAGQRGPENTGARQILADLAALYHRAGRHEDVLTLLKESPYWNAKDLSGLLDVSSGGDFTSVMSLHTGSSALTLPYLAASAFAATGQTNEAVKITDALLQVYPGSDRGYELLIALDPANALAKMDVLFARDQFEERPLIWKAYLLQKQGKLEEAEKVVRQAISIDPSDGEEGRGDRMRAYAVLADIRVARGDQKEAEFYRQVVQAIRLSENADQFYLAGLLKHAVAMYEDALNHFSDAYCIQSRLARQLSALGMNAAAEEHYRRAFELMPDSFGRVESHCFGCEKAFAGERAQNIAEQVFAKIAEERPDKPQVYYLLGYLRVEEERYTEASTNFLTAVHLDPEYLNAWVKLNEINSHVLLSPKIRESVALNIIRLDPRGRHATPSLERITDLVTLWNTVVAANKNELPPVSDLMPLPASEAEMKKNITTLNPNETAWDEQYARQGLQHESGESLTPGGAVGQTAFVALAGQIMDYNLNFVDN